MPLIEFKSFAVDVPGGWEDISGTVDAPEPPFTVACSDTGVGALQFSVALFNGGEIPDPSSLDLLEMVKRFGTAKGFEEPRDVVAESCDFRLAAGSFSRGCLFLRVWQLSDGKNFAFVTYNCESGEEGKELADCERIVRSIRFARTDSDDDLALQ
ncbi:MAG: hypothetical protein HZA46_17805 [Planctomycetales bacterium]|nr:hypothetical protein [Planctomycetales bacterium]